MPITVRKATVEDAAAVLRLNESNHDARATVEHIAEHIRQRAEFEMPFVAEVEGQVVGLACLRLLPSLCDSAPYAELTELIVDPQYRRRGVGRELHQRIEAEARAGGALNLVLMTAWRNTNAHAFYHELGYRLWTVMMQKKLE